METRIIAAFVLLALLMVAGCGRRTTTPVQNANSADTDPSVSFPPLSPASPSASVTPTPAPGGGATSSPPPSGGLGLLGWLSFPAELEVRIFGAYGSLPPSGFTTRPDGNRSCDGLVPPEFPSAAKQIYGVAGVDHQVVLCLGLVPRTLLGGFNFGGMYGYHFAPNANPPIGAFPNPATGSASCSNGFAPWQMTGTANVDYPSYLCLKPYTIGGHVLRFGGSYSDSPGDSGANNINLLTEQPDCPAGFTKANVLGTEGVDHQLFQCTRAI